MPKGRIINGVAVGPESPLLKIERVRQQLKRTEADEQKDALEVLLGRALPGQRREMGAGMTARYPELMLLTANNPNKGGRKKAAAGLAKAMGLLPDLPDLQLPVMRGPYIGLWVEVKALGEYPNQHQRFMHTLLREQGHCVLVAQGAQETVECVLGYLALPLNRVSARPVPSDLKHLPTIDERIVKWREQCHAMLTPDRRRSDGKSIGRY